MIREWLPDYVSFYFAPVFSKQVDSARAAWAMLIIRGVAFSRSHFGSASFLLLTLGLLV
jgi:hypothetical protein